MNATGGMYLAILIVALIIFAGIYFTPERCNGATRDVLEEYQVCSNTPNCSLTARQLASLTKCQRFLSKEK